MNHFYQNKTQSFQKWISVFVLAFWAQLAFGQITISTETGTNYTIGAQIAPPNAAAITFVIENNNAQAITLQSVDHFVDVDQSPATFKLWYSATSLSGTATLAIPTWTQVTTGTPITIAAAGIATVLSNINFVIPAGTQYRFALESSNGLKYTTLPAAPNPAPSPNVFSASSVNLKVGNNLIGGQNVGYAGAPPQLINFPRFFNGRIGFVLGVVACTQPTLPTLSSDTTICSGASATLNVTGGSLNQATQWRWYSASCGGVLAGSGTSLTVTPTTTTTYYVRGEGGCATPGACTAVTVTVKAVPGTPVINPVAAICLNSAQALTINPVATINSNVTVSSGTVALNIPDNTNTGVTSTLAVPALPAGAVITSMQVRLNIEHTYIGDVIANLRAPNGSILNLVKYLGATGNEGANFVNTIVSSAGTELFSAGSEPFTGIFRPDAINTAVGTAPVQNPAGYVSNAPNFAALYSVIGGNWTLALADGGPEDLGILREWAIIVNYSISGTAFPAVWSPASTLFTDAAASLPYDGTTPLFQVYAKPSVTTTYTAVSENLGCFSETPATIALVVNNPVAIGTGGNPIAAEICEFGTAQFIVQTTGTTPTYQWQTDNGNGTFTNITNNALYSGVTNDTLTVTDAPDSIDGYKYRCIAISVIPCTTQDTSTAALLTVNPTPTVSLSVAPYTSLLPGLVTTITVNSSPAAAVYSWFKDGLPVATLTSRSINLNSDGIGLYKATVVDVNGCTNTTGTILITDSVSSRLFIFPNPTQGQFDVCFYSLTGNSLPRTLMIYDAKGALVLNKTYQVAKPYSKMPVDFSGLSSGLYMVNLLDISGKRLASGKVIVQ